MKNYEVTFWTLQDQNCFKIHNSYNSKIFSCLRIKNCFYNNFIKEDDTADAETENLLVKIDCLTSKVLRETSLWNLQETR